MIPGKVIHLLFKECLVSALYKPAQWLAEPFDRLKIPSHLCEYLVLEDLCSAWHPTIFLQDSLFVSTAAYTWDAKLGSENLVLGGVNQLSNNFFPSVWVFYTHDAKSVTAIISGVDHWSHNFFQSVWVCYTQDTKSGTVECLVTSSILWPLPVSLANTWQHCHEMQYQERLIGSSIL